MNVQAATCSARYHVDVRGAHGPRYDEIVTPEALDFLRDLHRAFIDRRNFVLDQRFRRDVAGDGLRFRPETQAIRDDPSWRVAPVAPGLLDRRVEITGPVDAKMAINALNSGADVWMADFEDATSPAWANVIEGQLNLRDAIAGTLRHTGPQGKEYALGNDLATIVVRPRGWHLLERHIVVDGNPVPGSLVDFGLFFFHNARALIEQGAGPYFYLPKLESHLEARLWNDVFVFAQDRLGIPQGTIRATVLIETITAAFEMEEILYELRAHAAGLNAGRWDYIFSIIKNFGKDAAYVLPDRAEVTMTVPFMRAYTELLVRTCHKRGAYAIGGMAAVIPSRDAAEAALAKVRADKDREAAAGYDGSWVAHPGLVETCRTAFDAVLGDRSNQLDRLREDVRSSAADLLSVASTPGSVTAAGVRTNVSVLVRYLDAWLDGHGAVALDGLMEDAATAEISRCQLWQWIQHSTKLDDGTPVSLPLVAQCLDFELAALVKARPGFPGERIDALRDLVRFGVLRETLPPFITEYAYRRYLVRNS
ncbi:malate synthase A [Kribbella sandramycini]|uniref:Malate synthase n=1 Tax=Kribbella sandramycini TaxID=60450 RepID=A0A7Y4KX84_9ACTN|nr:malate synthase A [Kribbella sandramycini]MBB6569842.1 malate synthase [Kribbella sandramycini]NOL40333.1 malate synthase A [Kribbella sandramycini]